MTTKKTEASKSEKTKAKTTAKKKAEKLDLDAFTVTPTELGYILGLASSNIAMMIQNRYVIKDADGRINLRDAVSGYCKRMRESKAGANRTKTDLEVENMALKNEKLKEGLRSWRMQRDREVGLAIIQAMRTTMNQLRDECKLVPPLVQSIDAMIDVIDSINIETISYEIEGEEVDEEDS